MRWRNLRRGGCAHTPDDGGALSGARFALVFVGALVLALAAHCAVQWSHASVRASSSLGAVLP